MWFTKIANYFHGKTTLFAVFGLTSGTILAWYGHLSGDYVALLVACNGFLFGKSMKDDYFDNKKGGGMHGKGPKDDDCSSRIPDNA